MQYRPFVAVWPTLRTDLLAGADTCRPPQFFAVRPHQEQQIGERRRNRTRGRNTLHGDTRRPSVSAGTRYHRTRVRRFLEQLLGVKGNGEVLWAWNRAGEPANRRCRDSRRRGGQIPRSTKCEDGSGKQQWHERRDSKHPAESRPVGWGSTTAHGQLARSPSGPLERSGRYSRVKSIPADRSTSACDHS